MNFLQKIVENNRGLVWGVVFLIVLLVIIFLKKYNIKKKRKHARFSKKNTYTVKDCISNEDLQFKIDSYQKKLENELEKNKRLIQEAKQKGYIKASTEWTERFQELTKVSNTLNKNLEYENSRRLINDKFHRYTNLHFRSVIMGNLAYSDYIDSKKVRDEINKLLVAIGKKQVRVTASEKRELYNIKDTCVETTKYLYERMVSIQDNTGTLRDKIRDECGGRGNEWYRKITMNKK